MFSKLKYVLFAFMFLVIAGIAAASFVIEKKIKEPNGITQSVLIEIADTGGVQGAAAILTEKNLISNRSLYVYATKIFGKKIKPGYYEVPAGSSIVEIINLLDSGNVKVVKITIPEGWRLEQIGRKLDQEGILPYDDFVTAAKPYEGKLFPDTYYLDPRMESKDVIKMMTNNFAARTADLNLSDGDLVLASIVEREAAKDSERASIAGVYQNRLDRKMKLEADPTVQYAKDTNNLKLYLPENKLEYKFWQPVGFADYRNVQSEFNTYLNPGLPPGPICNPGIKSIEAALSPEKHNYVYFLQYDGQIYFAKTLAEHDANRRRILGQQ